MADPAAGDRIVASNGKHPFDVNAAASADLTLSATTTPSDITGATVTFNTVQAAATVRVIGVFDVSVGTSAAALAEGICSIDGTAQTALAIAQLQTVGTRYTIVQVWTATLSGSGPHTIKLRGQLNTASGAATFHQTHTTVTVTVNDF